MIEFSLAQLLIVAGVWLMGVSGLLGPFVKRGIEHYGVTGR